MELYLTPSKLMFSTAGVLCALAVGLAVIIALLQAREKVSLLDISGWLGEGDTEISLLSVPSLQYQDRQERKQAKHKFHFNAM